MKRSSPPLLLPERLCMLWGGFAAFVIAFGARMVASGSPASAVFSGCVGCLVGGWLGRMFSQYLNYHLRPAPEVDRDEEDSPASESAPPRT